MSKKALKKELEQNLIRVIEELLQKQDGKVAAKLKKNIKEAGKTLSKKFFKISGTKPKAKTSKKTVSLNKKETNTPRPAKTISKR